MSYHSSSVTGNCRSRTRPLPELPPVQAAPPPPAIDPSAEPIASAPPAAEPAAEPVLAAMPAPVAEPPVAAAPIAIPAPPLAAPPLPMAADSSTVILPSATGPLAPSVAAAPVAPPPAVPVAPAPKSTLAQTAASLPFLGAGKPRSAFGAVVAGLWLALVGLFSRSRR